jgi:hypothetical protein
MQKLKSSLKKANFISAITLFLLVAMQGICQRYVLAPKIL